MGHLLARCVCHVTHRVPIADDKEVACEAEGDPKRAMWDRAINTGSMKEPWKACVAWKGAHRCNASSCTQKRRVTMANTTEDREFFSRGFSMKATFSTCIHTYTYIHVYACVSLCVRQLRRWT